MITHNPIVIDNNHTAKGIIIDIYIYMYNMIWLPIFIPYIESVSSYNLFCTIHSDII